MIGMDGGPGGQRPLLRLLVIMARTTMVETTHIRISSTYPWNSAMSLENVDLVEGWTGVAYKRKKIVISLTG